jgi:hypothetical protein
MVVPLPIEENHAQHVHGERPTEAGRAVQGASPVPQHSLPGTVSGACACERSKPDAERCCGYRKNEEMISVIMGDDASSDGEDDGPLTAAPLATDTLYIEETPTLHPPREGQVGEDGSLEDDVVLDVVGPELFAATPSENGAVSRGSLRPPARMQLSVDEWDAAEESLPPSRGDPIRVARRRERGGGCGHEHSEGEGCRGPARRPLGGQGAEMMPLAQTEGCDGHSGSQGGSLPHRVTSTQTSFFSPR